MIESVRFKRSTTSHAEQGPCFSIRRRKGKEIATELRASGCQRGLAAVQERDLIRAGCPKYEKDAGAIPEGML
jgi:hypothetical protein